MRQLMRANRADQATFEALKSRYGVQWLVELTVPAPADGDRFPA